MVLKSQFSERVKVPVLGATEPGAVMDAIANYASAPQRRQQQQQRHDESNGGIVDELAQGLEHLDARSALCHGGCDFSRMKVRRSTKESKRIVLNLHSCAWDKMTVFVLMFREEQKKCIKKN